MSSENWRTIASTLAVIVTTAISTCALIKSSNVAATQALDKLEASDRLEDHIQTDSRAIDFAYRRLATQDRKIQELQEQLHKLETEFHGARTNPATP